ncbi:hypothetical protein PR202_gb11035 [Eleusine coracana subsp. coracana]|uniref:Vacuolar protein sorting-associated protein 51 homolog n=1 Tax=Eleusine coracana subsp. coracana TaxID=191504 RepID=A0AAV5EL23_ELECO|nr:hypothetical protein PR202_gb11035 [Eleusine coracana subsp. coracana]
MDEKARRTRDLLASFYNTDSSASAATPASPASLARLSPTATAASPLDSINSTSFDPEIYMNVLVQQSNLESLLQRHVKMAAEIKNLDTDLQMLVYENYNKFISATDTIKRMKTNIVGMEANMEQLLAKFIYDLPTRLNKCIKTEAYADAVRFFTGAKPIFEAYGDTSFQECKKASEEAMDLVIQHLQEKLYSDAEPIEARAEAVVLLKQLNYPVDNLKSNLLEKLEDCLLNLQNEPTQASIVDISKTFRAYLIIFPDSERRLIELAQALFSNRYETVRENLKRRVSSTDLLTILRPVYTTALLTTRDIIRQHIATAFCHLQSEISDVLIRTYSTSNQKLEESQLQTTMETSKTKVSQGCIDLLQEFHHLIDGNTELLVKLRDLIIDWVQEGFQDFFQKLDRHFHFLSGRSKSFSQESSALEPVQIDKVPAALVLMLAQLCVYIEQTTIPKVTEELASSFSGGGARSYEYGPPFVPGEICRLYHSSGEKLLHHVGNILLSSVVTVTEILCSLDQYINMKTQKISKLLNKRFTTPVWTKESVISTVLKLCLKSLQEFVRLQTFNRSGFQQIQLDMEFLKNSLREFIDDEAAVSFLLKEV